MSQHHGPKSKNIWQQMWRASNFLFLTIFATSVFFLLHQTICKNNFAPVRYAGGGRKRGGTMGIYRGITIYPDIHKNVESDKRSPRDFNCSHQARSMSRCIMCRDPMRRHLQHVFKKNYDLLGYVPK